MKVHDFYERKTTPPQNPPDRQSGIFVSSVNKNIIFASVIKPVQIDYSLSP